MECLLQFVNAIYKLSAILILVQLLRVWIVKGRAWLEMDGIISGCRLVSGDRDRENAVCLT